MTDVSIDDVPGVKPAVLDLAWGARAIAKTIGKTTRATFHLLEQGKIPARKIGGQWVASRAKLREYFEGAGHE